MSMTTTSADGTTISYHAVGQGPTVVVVNGAMSTAADGVALADALVAAGCTAVTYDRRARAGSGDATDGPHPGTTAPVDPTREVEDLASVLAAVDSPVAVFGHSSGAVLALLAASRGLPAAHLFLSEPPFRFGVAEADADLPDRMLRLIDEGHPDEAVLAFQLEGVGLPPELVEQIRMSPIFPGLVALARSTVYDATLTRNVSTPTEAMLAVSAPVTVLLGSDTFPVLEAAAPRLAEAIAGAELVHVPESIGHRPDPEATVRVITQRWPG
ncbi:alpha/beta fold hydrolase [Microbacterium sp.]|uniref:alpha/beta fold hydrolase n=1 Tax=Microbacterium sp. TaxID=51671 RepID=UPI003A87F264